MTISSPSDPMTVRRVSPDTDPFFHGFYGLPIWDRDDRYILVHRAPYADRMPAAGDRVTLGRLDTRDGTFEPLAESSAWNFQVGTLAQFVGHGNRIWFNTHHESGCLGSCLIDLDRDRATPCDGSIFWVSPEGAYAVGFDQERAYRVWPGYSYAPLQPAPPNDPDGDGLRKIQPDGRPWQLLLSYAAVADLLRPHGYRNEFLFFSRLLGADDGRGFTFSARTLDADRRVQTHILTLDLQSAETRVLIPAGCGPAHFHYYDPRTLFVWLKHPPVADGMPGFYFWSLDHDAVRPFRPGILKQDGHCQFVAATDQPDDPARATLLCDTFPQADGCQYLLAVPAQDGPGIELARFPAATIAADLRSDLHPCVSRGRQAAAVDSFHEAVRGVYIVTLNR